ncbi:Fad synthase, partial [Globisporangium splendens]
MASTAPSAAQNAPSAAICVIANEVLTGKTHDTNSFFIAKLMFRRGIDVKRVIVIPDELDIISSTVKELSDLVGPTGYVFTTGGIGPTHDDLTYEGVAKAFGVGLELHQPTADALREFAIQRGYDGALNEDALRMATLPERCTVLSTGSWVPLAVVHNVYVLPGIPSMVTDMLTYNEDHFVGVPIHRVILHTLKIEALIAKSMKAIQKKYAGVAIGSYVNLTLEKTGVKDESYNTRITIEGRNLEEVENTTNELIQLCDGKRVQLESNPDSAL